MIDSDFRHEVIALIRNHGRAEVKIEKNERLLQMVIMKNPDVKILEVEQLSAVGVERTGGFGSTGIIYQINSICDSIETVRRLNKNFGSIHNRLKSDLGQLGDSGCSSNSVYVTTKHTFL